MLQVQMQPLFRLLAMKPSILCVLIAQWQLSAINLSTLTLTTTLHNNKSWHNPTVKTWSPLILQASCDHTFNPKCAHNLMGTQCNQPQHHIPLNKICAHIPSASQNNQVSLSNSLASPYPPDPGEHILKRSATATGKQDFPVKWFKFIHPNSKPRMTETPVQNLSMWHIPPLAP